MRPVHSRDGGGSGARQPEEKEEDEALSSNPRLRHALRVHRGFLSATPPKHRLPTVTPTPVMAATAGVRPGAGLAWALTSRLPPNCEEERWLLSSMPSCPHTKGLTPSMYGRRGGGLCR
ncbi:hypothetical protein Srubr_27730 [Streptomyces rubradiris]|uniref:Uncharacterized protein n=1 Tax=Streptomyces rubradiris TaxID=285531 RepID=A0ABQ3RAP2_STRRR|nr:hypothetical protein GCM10018792_50610 [Streptomyces rubradiris]GHI52927.1 hypothetical protein Srubr_27730 [Streptomyces rubradiris]